MSAPLPLSDVQPALRAEEVEAFLAAHPSFLTERPGLYRSLVPPRRLHGDRLADHMAAMIEVERARAHALEAEMRDAAEAGRDRHSLSIRVRLAVLALMRASDVLEAVTQEVPALLGVETCTLAAEPAPAVGMVPPGVLRLPRGAVTQLIGRGREAVVRSQPTDTVLLHAEAAPLVMRDALARVPLPSGVPMLLALGARVPATLPQRQTLSTIAFLGRAVAAALIR